MSKARAAKARGSAKPAAAEPPADPVEQLRALPMDQLTTQLDELRSQLAVQARIRNLAQVERDKIAQFWEVTKTELERKKARLKNLQGAIEDEQKENRAETKQVEQKVTTDLDRHENELKRIDREKEMLLKQASGQHDSKLGELKKEKRELKEGAADAEGEFISHVTNQKVQENAEVLSKSLEAELDALKARLETKLAKLREDLELRRKVELREIEERKNKHINELLSKHRVAFAEAKRFYNEVTRSNLAMIRSLKAEIEQYDKAHAAIQHQRAELQAKTDELRPQREIAEMKVKKKLLKLANFEKDRASLQSTTQRIVALKEQIAKLSAEHAELEARFAQVQQERDDLEARYEDALERVRSKCSVTCDVLNARIEGAHQELQAKETQLNEILQASQLDPSALRAVTQKLDDVLTSKNRAIRDLQYEVHRVTKAHNDAVRVYEAKLIEFGVPPEELGYEPVLTRTTTGPAGLVSALG